MRKAAASTETTAPAPAAGRLMAPQRLRDVVSAHWRAATSWQTKAEVAIGVTRWVPRLAWYEVRWLLWRKPSYWMRGRQQALVFWTCHRLWWIEGWERRWRERAEGWLRARPWAVKGLMDEPPIAADETQINLN